MLCVRWYLTLFEKLTLPLRSRAHLRDYGSHEHPMLRHRSQRPGSPRTCRQPGRGWAAHARPTCAPSLTRSFTCCEPVASGACYPASSRARAPFTITFVPGKMRAADENRMGAPTTRPMQGGKYSVFYEANVRTNTRKSANPTRSYDQRISQIHEPHSRESLRNSQKFTNSGGS